MAQRAYRRDSRGRFAGSGGGGGGTKVTMGKAGGFANRQHLAKASAARLAKGRSRRRRATAKRVGKDIAAAMVGHAAGVGVLVGTGVAVGALQQRKVNKGLSLINRQASAVRSDNVLRLATGIKKARW